MIAITPSGQNLIVSFKYNPEVIGILKNFPFRTFNPATKTWRLPKDSLTDLEEQFKKANLEYVVEDVSDNNNNCVVFVPSKYKFTIDKSSLDDKNNILIGELASTFNNEIPWSQFEIVHSTLKEFGIKLKAC